MMLIRSRKRFVRSCITVIPYLLAALYTFGSHGGDRDVMVRAYTYNSKPFLYADDNQQATNATYPVQEYLPVKLNDMNDRPDFIYNSKPGEYRIIEYYVHCKCICQSRL